MKRILPAALIVSFLSSLVANAADAPPVSGRWGVRSWLMEVSVAILWATRTAEGAAGDLGDLGDCFAPLYFFLHILFFSDRYGKVP